VSRWKLRRWRRQAQLGQALAPVSGSSELLAKATARETGAAIARGTGGEIAIEAPSGPRAALPPTQRRKLRSGVFLAKLLPFPAFPTLILDRCHLKKMGGSAENTDRGLLDAAG